jgi:hypothetical protein
MPFLAGFSLIQKIAGGFALGLVLLLALAWQIEKRQANKLRAQLEKCEAFRKQLAEESERKKAEVSERIIEGRERIVYVDRVARGIEAAPLPGNCATPPAILGADL